MVGRGIAIQQRSCALSQLVKNTGRIRVLAPDEAAFGPALIFMRGYVVTGSHHPRSVGYRPTHGVNASAVEEMRAKNDTQ